MDSLKDILIQELDKYTGVGINCIVMPVYDHAHHTYALTVASYPQRKGHTIMFMLVRVVGEKIVIEEDTTDKKLVDALLQQGIPRDKIILAYEGEPAPEFQVS